MTDISTRIKPDLFNTTGHREPTPVNIAGGTALQDAFGRMRVGEPRTVFDYKHNYGKDHNFWYEATSGGGSSSTWLPDESSIELVAGTGATDYAMRQTYRYFNYTPGRSFVVGITGILGAQKTGADQRIGYFDD